MEEPKLYTLQEACECLNETENALMSKFGRTKEKLKKKHIIVEKLGRGKNVKFHIEFLHPHQETFILEENKHLPMYYDNVLSAPDLEFAAFIGVGCSPNMAFSGSYRDFVKYLCLTDKKENAEAIKIALENLASRGMIRYYPDDTNPTWFLAGISWRSYDRYAMSLNTIKGLLEIQKKNKKQSWIPLVKTYGAHIFYSELLGADPHTYAEIMAQTGLNENAVKESAKILEQEGAIVSDKITAVVDGKPRCLGKSSYKTRDFGDKIKRGMLKPDEPIPIFTLEDEVDVLRDEKNH